MTCPLTIRSAGFFALFLGFLPFHIAATTYYVDINSPNPTPPYNSWATASTDIQSAVNLTANGDLVLVNPGVYQSGGYTAPSELPTGVVVSNAVTLQSMEGAAATSIMGSNGICCIYLASGAVLAGFTVTNGGQSYGGGVYCASTNALVTNCLIINNQGFFGAGAYNGTCVNCTFTGNMATNTRATCNGGGARECTLNNCYLNNNISLEGGGASDSVLNNCIVSNNVVLPLEGSLDSGLGGGVVRCTVQDSLIISNSAPWLTPITPANTFGGGAFNSTLVNCIIQGNLAWEGGGASIELGSNYTINDCTLTGNTALKVGGGFAGCTGLIGPVYGTVPVLTNCVISGNQAWEGGGGYFLWQSE